METKFDLTEGKQIQEVNALALSVPDQAKQITAIQTNEDYIRASDILLIIKEIRKKIDATFKPIKQKMDAAKNEVLDQERAAVRPLAEAEAYIKPLIAGYMAEQERRRKEEENRLREIARKEEEERQLQAAIQAEAEGQKEEAEAIISAPVQAAPVVVPKTIPKVAGVTMVKQWKFRIVDAAKVPRQYLIVDEQKIGAVVRALKDQANISGVEVFCVDSISAGRRIV
ncbi:MAG: hypothetical protein WC347_02555 [Smithellaceae bacterium]|jgi:hypothetical protein